MGFSGNQNPKVGLDSGRKRKRRHGLSVAVTLKLLSEKSEEKEAIKAPAMGSKKGCMKGKGGPQNRRQRVWGRCVAEIRVRTEGKGFDTAFGAAMDFDEASRAMYAEKPILNMPHVWGSDSVGNVTDRAVSDNSMTASNGPEICSKYMDLDNGCNLASLMRPFTVSTLSQAFPKATTAAATCAGSDSMTSVSINFGICAKNVGFEDKTTRMNVEFPADSEPPLTTGRMNLTVNEIQDACAMKPEAETSKEAKPGDGESMMVTDYCWLDGFEFFDDIPMDFGGFYDEIEFFNVDEFLG